MDRWKTQNIEAKGGLNTSTDTLSYQPGEAVELINFEPGIYGGYRRLSGYAQYSSTQLPGGSSKVLGVCVFNAAPGGTNGVMACQGAHVYFGRGGAWTQIDTTDRTSAGRYMFCKYFFDNARIITMCDGVNPAAKWDGTTYTLINGSSTPANPKYAAFINQSLVLAGYTNNGGASCISISAPGADTDFTGVDGAIEINVSDNIVGIRNFRETLYIFCTRSIWELTGTSSTNYAIQPVAKGIGCLAYDSIQESNGDLVYLSADGIRTLSGTMKLNDTELGDLSKPIIDLANSVYSFAGGNPDNICSTIVRRKNQYRLFYTTPSTQASMSPGIIGAIRPGKQSMTQFGTYISVWEWATMQGIQCSCADSDFQSGTELIVHGGLDGYVYQQEFGSSFNGSNIYASYTTAPLQLEDTEVRKLIQKLTLYIHLEGNAAITCQPIYDFNNSYITMQPLSVAIPTSSFGYTYGNCYYGSAYYSGGTQLYQARTNIQGSGKIVQLQFYSSDMNPSYSIQGVSLQYRLLGRR